MHIPKVYYIVYIYTKPKKIVPDLKTLKSTTHYRYTNIKAYVLGTCI